MANSGRTGVVYADGDYIGAVRRLVIEAVDTAAAVTATALVIMLMALFTSPSAGVAFIASVAVWFAYFVLLKRSRFRTLVYRVAGARIVNLQGESPSYASLTGRLLFAAAGPFNFLLDIWISSDSCHQALRDKFAHTYVVRKLAVPSGTGPIVYASYTVFGGTLLFPEVRPEATR
jgi:uncharacterized RDD family membrane protein YckC